MKKSFLFSVIILLFLCPVVLAESWDDYSGIDRAWDGQKSITNKEFEEVMNALEEKKIKKEEKQRKKKIKKVSGGGTSLHPEQSPNVDITELEPLKKQFDERILNTPVKLYTNEGILDKGFYKIIAEKEKDNNIYLKFYQSQFYKGKVKAQETEDDSGEDCIDFVKLVPYNENYVRIIYGSLDFNAHAYLRYSEE